MKIKKGASLQGLHIIMRSALKHTEKMFKLYGHELVVTSGLDGTHSAGSFHYYGFAFDCRTWWFKTKKIESIAREIRTGLGSKFDVVVEHNHIHIEYTDPYEFINERM